MSKYIIEIKPEYEDSFKGLMILGAKDSNLFVDTLAVENLEQYTPVDVEKIYDKASADGYNRGLEDGKADRKKGCDGCRYEHYKAEICQTCMNNYVNHWESAKQDDKIEVGDEVTYKSDSITWTAVVTQNDNGMLTLMGETGAIAEGYDEKCFVKTGRHFNIASILEAMKHD